MHVYTKSGDMAYFIAYDGKVYRFTFATELLQYLGVLETKSQSARQRPDPQRRPAEHWYALVFRYAGINQNKFVDFVIQTGQVTTIDSNIATYGIRDLIFGGLAKGKFRPRLHGGLGIREHLDHKHRLVQNKRRSLCDTVYLRGGRASSTRVESWRAAIGSPMSSALGAM